MKLGFDVDGVLANFSAAYMDLIVKVTGKDLFPPEDRVEASHWDWDLNAGYTREDRKNVFVNHIATAPDFHLNLRPTKEVTAVFQFLRQYGMDHDVYFITNRGAKTAKMQTEQWLSQYVDPNGATVLIVKEGVKGHVANALSLDIYIDDKYENIIDCYDYSPRTRAYLLDKRYNRLDAVGRGEESRARLLWWDEAKGGYATFERKIEEMRVSSIAEMLAREGLIDYRVNAGSEPTTVSKP